MANKQDQGLRKRAADKLKDIFELYQHIQSVQEKGDWNMDYDYVSPGNKKGENYYQIETAWGGTIRFYCNSDFSVWRIEWQLLLKDGGWIIIKGKEYNLPDEIFKWFQDSKVVQGTFLHEDYPEDFPD